MTRRGSGRQAVDPRHRSAARGSSTRCLIQRLPTSCRAARAADGAGGMSSSAWRAPLERVHGVGLSPASRGAEQVRAKEQGEITEIAEKRSHCSHRARSRRAHQRPDDERTDTKKST